jgi:PEGA domain
MRRTIASSLVVLSTLGNSLFAQQDKALSPAPSTPAATTAAAPTEPAKPAAPPPPNTLLDGTAVKLRLAETISSSSAKVGQQIPFEVTEDVMVEGITVLPKGAQALASVTDASPKKSMGRGGKLNVNVDSARLADGEKVQLRAVQDNKGGGHVGAMTGAMVATAIVFFPAAPLFLFIHGKDISIPKGTEVTAFVQGDMRLDMAKFTPADAPLAPAVTADSLTIDATVPNCDIEVDGNFVGNTPSSLNLAPGKHAIVVKKTGYQTWSRTMLVSTGAVRLNAEMVR